MSKIKHFNLGLIAMAFAVALAVALAVAACASNNARESLNWEGLYTGTIPSASGMGINVQLTLRADQTYTLISDYVGKSGFSTVNGAFNWDEKGGIITLKGVDSPPYYIVEKDRLLQLDMQGKKISGNLADMYILKKAQ